MEEEAVSKQKIFESAVGVITKPAEVFRRMPGVKGIGQAVLFLAVMFFFGVLVDLIGTALVIRPKAFAGGLIILVTGPVIMVLLSFVAAAVLFVVWKIMGSKEDYATAFRCLAYFSAIAPLTSAIAFIPYVGNALIIIWFSYLLITASVHAHKIKTVTAWSVMGAIGVLLVVLNINAEIKMRQSGDKLTREALKLEQMREDFNKEIEEAREKAP